jgi:hypothetical protein
VTWSFNNALIVSALVIVARNGRHNVLRVGAPTPWIAVTAKYDGRGLVRVRVIDPEGPAKLV